MDIMVCLSRAVNSLAVKLLSYSWYHHTSGEYVEHIIYVYGKGNRPNELPKTWKVGEYEFPVVWVEENE